MLNEVEPQHRCDKHIDADDPPTCGACMAAQKIHAKWLKAQQAAEEQRERDAETERRYEQQQIAAEAIYACGLCDDEGYAGAHVCDHVDRTETSRRGSALVRAELERLAAQRKARA